MPFQKLTIALLAVVLGAAAQARSQEIVGTNVVPHIQSPMLKWRRPPDPELSARAELFLRNTTEQEIVLSDLSQVQFDGQTPQELLEDSQWAWHDTPAVWKPEAISLSPGEMMVWKINGQSAGWGVDTWHRIQWPSGIESSYRIETPTCHLSAIAFLATDSDGKVIDQPFPNRAVIHVKNSDTRSIQMGEVRLWAPTGEFDGRVFRSLPGPFIPATLPSDGTVRSGEKGILLLDSIQVPLGQLLVEVTYRTEGDPSASSMWAAVKVKSEVFDISGGWIASNIGQRNSLTIDEYLKTLSRMHINTGQIQEVDGYTNDAKRYQQYPFKRFNRMADLARYDTDELLPTIHAVEFIGEPQFGGGSPVAPQRVWEMLEPYRTSRLPTSVTLSEERTWRYYAGLSDYPHYDAYRVIAPAADHWRGYDWGGSKIGWGAPLETIGEMTRSLRQLSRPAPIAYWSQGAHDDWSSFWHPRRESPTPDELRSQAWHGLANRVTSLYWFNLSLKSLVKFPDLIDPITRINREIRLLDEFFLCGDAYENRVVSEGDRPSWEIASIAAPDGILLTVHDLSYQPDLDSRVFRFEKRTDQWRFRLPPWLDQPLTVFAIDADGPREVDFIAEKGWLQISDSVKVVGIYIATTDSSLTARMEALQRFLVDKEQATGFDPAGNAQDLQRLAEYLE
jgi:hypothetical protein